MNKHTHCFNCTFCAKLINRPLILICFHPVCLECINPNQKEEIINSQKFIKIQCKKCSLFTLFSQDFSEKYSDKDLKDFLNSDLHSIQSNRQKTNEDEKKQNFNNINFNNNNNNINLQIKPKQIEQQFQPESNQLEIDDDQNQKQIINNSSYRNMSPSNKKFQEQKNGIIKNINQQNQQQQTQQNQNILDKTINKNNQQYNQAMESTQNRNQNNQNQKIIIDNNPKVFNIDQQPYHKQQEANKENMNQIQNFTTFQPYNQLQSTGKENDVPQLHYHQNEQQQYLHQSQQKKKRSIPKVYNRNCAICQNNNKLLEENINNYSRNCICCDQIDKQNSEDKTMKIGQVFELSDSLLAQKYNNIQKSIGICSQHSSEPLLFCIDCKQFICLECHFIRNEHKNHHIQPIKQSLSQIGEHSQRMFDGLMFNEQDINKQIEHAQMNHNILGKKHQETLQQLTLLFKKIQLELQKKEVQLTSQIDQFYSDRLKSNHVSLQNLNFLKSKIPDIKSAATSLQSNYQDYSNSINSFHHLQIFTNFLNKIKPIVAESGNQIPQIIFDKNLKILSEIQNFAYFQQTPAQKQQEKVLTQSFHNQTHTNLQSFMQPDLKDLNNSQYKQYLKNHKENLLFTRSSLKQMKESGKKEKQLNSSYKKVQTSPYHRQLEIQRQDQGLMERIQGIKKNIY